MTRPLLTLCMIVRDEAHGIARTLASAKPFVDRWCIFDTGSTDGTPGIVLEELAGMAGWLRHVPFVDFATTRNALLRKAGDPLEADLAANGFGGGEFLLLLDADDILEGGEALRAALEVERMRHAIHPKACSCLGGPCAVLGAPIGDPYAPDDEGKGPCGYSPSAWDAWESENDRREAFYLRVQQGVCTWSSARVVRADAVGPNGWHYVGAVHEVLVKHGAPPPSITIPGVTIRHEPAAVSVEKSRARWERDAKLLATEVEKDPTNARAVFYLAKTYKQLGDVSRARMRFRDRIALGGWREEVFESRLELARCVVSETNKILDLLDAAAFAPHRAEPLVDLAMHYREKAEHGLAFLFAARAAQLPYPAGDSLFVDAGVYAWRAAALVSISAWYIGEWEAGEAATRKALAGNPPAEWRTALEDNLRLYEERKR